MLLDITAPIVPFEGFGEINLMKVNGERIFAKKDELYKSIKMHDK